MKPLSQLCTALRTPYGLLLVAALVGVAVVFGLPGPTSPGRVLAGAGLLVFPVLGLARVDTEVQRQMSELERIIRRYSVEIPQEVETVRNRLAAAEQTIATAGERFESLRRDRQALLVEGKDAAEITAQVEAVQAEVRLAEDLSQGLRVKIEQLEAESVRLQREDVEEKRRQVYDLKVSPLVDAYNASAAQLGEIVENIHRTALECGVAFNRTSARVVPSENAWEAFQTVPRLRRIGEDGTHFFHAPWFFSKWSRTMAAKKEQG